MHRTSLHFLADMRDAAGKIEEYTRKMTYEQFLSDKKTQDAVVRNFEIIGEASKNLPEDLKTRYPAIAWKRIAGLRDIIAHGYFRVDYETLWDVIIEILPQFRKDLTRIYSEEKKRERDLDT